MSGQYLVPLLMGLMSVISVVIPLHTFLNDGLNPTCNIFLCCLLGLLIMGLIMLWGHYIICRR